MNEFDPNNYRNLGKFVTTTDAGSRIDGYLAKNFCFLTRSGWSQKLRLGQVLVNLNPVKSSYRLRENDKICYFCPPWFEPQVNEKIKVIWEERGIMGVYKPPNLPMHEGGKYRKNTFHELLRGEIGSEWSAVHRLDRETSGLVLCAGSSKLRNSLSQALRSRKIQKTYVAIVQGRAATEVFWVDEP